MNGILSTFGLGVIHFFGILMPVQKTNMSRLLTDPTNCFHRSIQSISEKSEHECGKCPPQTVVRIMNYVTFEVVSPRNREIPSTTAREPQR